MMMKSIYIRNFKKLKELYVPKVGQVNLIVGNNNVGKSTLLEAVSLYLANGNAEWMWDLLEERGESINVSRREENSERLVKQHVISLFSGRNEDYHENMSIVLADGKDDEEAVTVSQVYIGENSQVDEDGFRIRSRKAFFEESRDVMADEFAAVMTGYQVRAGKAQYAKPYSRLTSGSTTSHKCSFQMVRTIDFRPQSNEQLFDRIALLPEEAYIIQALNIINPDINKVSFINDDAELRNRRVPIVSLKGSTTRIRLSSMGDGINRVMTIILAMLNCKDGVLLIDEFETGLHYSVQEKLWDVVFMLSERLNVQVFATTHSNDCIRSFATANNQQGFLIRLNAREGTIVPTLYDNSAEMLFALDNQIEMR